MSTLWIIVSSVSSPSAFRAFENILNCYVLCYTENKKDYMIKINKTRLREQNLKNGILKLERTGAQTQVSLFFKHLSRLNTNAFGFFLSTILHSINLLYLNFKNFLWKRIFKSWIVGSYKRRLSFLNWKNFQISWFF